MNRTLRPLLLAISVLLLLAFTVQAKGPVIRLSPQQETLPVTESNGSGNFSYTIDGSSLCYTLEVRNLTGAPFGAHIHTGARNVAGGIVVGLETPPAATSSVSGCITAVADATGSAALLSIAEFEAIIANPRSFYVNVHTDLYAPGEIRGQLK